MIKYIAKVSKMTLQTNSFKISRYILLALVLVLCIGIITWTLINHHNATKANDSTVENVIRITNNNPCVQQVNNTISQLWAYDFNNVPQKYKDMINAYLNETIPSRINGMCNNTKFVCRAGQIRGDCDPCAAGSAKQFAMEKHISDTIAEQCK